MYKSVQNAFLKVTINAPLSKRELDKLKKKRNEAKLMKTMLSEGPAEVIINPVRLRYSSLRKRIIAGACALVGAAAVLSIAYYPTLQKFRTIDVIYDVLDKIIIIN